MTGALWISALSAVATVAWYTVRWKHIEDIDRPGDVYLSRLMLIRTPWFGVYFHIIRRPDWSRCQHDHPWPFVTLILRGGYVEEVGGQTFTRRAGYIGYRPSSFEHSITRLLDGPAYTMVLRGPNREAWGFRTPEGKVPWERYMKLPNALRVLWCGENDNRSPLRRRGSTQKASEK